MRNLDLWYLPINTTLTFGFHLLTLKVLVTTIDAQWAGMGDVGAARYEPALHSSSPTISVLSHSNCQRSTHSSNGPSSLSVNYSEFSTLTEILLFFSVFHSLSTMLCPGSYGKGF